MLGALRAVGIVCLPAYRPRAGRLELDIGGFNRKLVLDNDVVFGTVNANRPHYRDGGRRARARRPGLAGRG